MTSPLEKYHTANALPVADCVLLVTGLRHQTATIDIREQLSLSEQEIREALTDLAQHPMIEECAIINTCNRTEIYALVRNTRDGLQAIHTYLGQKKQFDWQMYRQATFTWLNTDAILHLHRVASGLDSLILGEGQIQGQVKEALANAQRTHSAGPVLDRLFKSALSTGKKVRSETGIDQRDTSISEAAFAYIQQHVPHLNHCQIAVVGGGTMAELMLGYFHKLLPAMDAKAVTIINRSEQRLRYLTGKYGYAGKGWSDAREVLQQADVVFVATGAPHVVLGKDDFACYEPSSRVQEYYSAQGGLADKTQWVLDVAVPRNVDAEVASLGHIKLLNTDDLAGYGRFTGETEARLRLMADTLVEDAYLEFYHWWQSRKVTPAIQRIREKFETIRQQETAGCAQGRLPTETATALEHLSKSLINKILHEPMVRLKDNEQSHQQALEAAQLLARLFGVEDELPVLHAEPFTATAGSVPIQRVASDDVVSVVPVQLDAEAAPQERAISEAAAAAGCPFHAAKLAGTSFDPAQLIALHQQQAKSERSMPHVHQARG